MMAMFFYKINYFLAVASNCNPNKDNPGHSLFGLPTWWEYITTGQKDVLGHCTPVVDFPNGAWAIAFAAIDMLLYLAGIVAVVSIIIAGVQYVTSLGNTDSTTKARKRIQNSLIGLAIVVAAAPIVSFIGNKVG